MICPKYRKWVVSAGKTVGRWPFGGRRILIPETGTVVVDGGPCSGKTRLLDRVVSLVPPWRPLAVVTPRMDQSTVRASAVPFGPVIEPERFAAGAGWSGRTLVGRTGWHDNDAAKPFSNMRECLLAVIETAPIGGVVLVDEAHPWIGDILPAVSEGMLLFVAGQFRGEIPPADLSLFFGPESRFFPAPAGCPPVRSGMGVAVRGGKALRFAVDATGATPDMLTRHAPPR